MYNYSEARLRCTMGNKIMQPIDARNFGCYVSLNPRPIRTGSGGGGGDSQGNPTRGGENAIFSCLEGRGLTSNEKPFPL